MSTKRLRMLVLLFCLVAGGYSGWLVVKSLVLAPNQETVWHVEQIKRPVAADKAGDEDATTDAYVDDYTHGQIQVFKTYMDSLQSANPRMYDSVLTARPRLMDSVVALERIYHLQNQK